MSGYTCPAAFPGLTRGGPGYNFSLAVAIVFPCFVVVSVWLFWYFHGSSLFLRKRHVSIVIASGAGCLVAWAATAMYDAVGPDRFPCALHLFLNVAFVPMINLPPLAALARYRNEVATYILAQKRHAARGSIATETVTEKDPIGNITWWQAFVGHVKTVLGSKDKQVRLQHAKFARSPLFIVFYGGINISPWVIYFFVKLGSDQRYYSGCYGCELDSADAGALLAFGLLGSGMGSLLNSSRVKRHDALRIVRECFFIWLTSGIFFTLAYILFLVDPGDAYKNGYFNFRIIISIGAGSVLYLQTLHQVWMARRLRIQIMTSQHVNQVDVLRDVLSNKELKQELKSHLLSELSAEIIPFMDAVEAFRQHFSGGSDDDQKRVKRIMDTFITRSAPLEINISYATRTELQTRTARGECSVDLYDHAFDEMRHSLMNDGFARFLREQKRRTQETKPCVTHETSVTSPTSVVVQESPA